MFTYFFTYETTDLSKKELVPVTLRAKNLSSALRLFWIDSKNYLLPVKRLSRAYRVTALSGKSSLRILKDNVKVYPHEEN